MSSFDALEYLGFVQSHTDVAAYHDFIRRGESRAGLTLSEELEQYLVRMLAVSVRSNEVSRRLALILLDAQMAHSTSDRAIMLHELGFEALKLAGFFPGQIDRRRVSLRYVKDMARVGYGSLGAIDPERVSDSPILTAFIPLGGRDSCTCRCVSTGAMVRS